MLNNKHVSKKRWLVYTKRCDYFTGYERKEHWFQTAIEAWEFYQSQRRYDYDFEESYAITYYPRLMPFADKYILPKQREHKRSAEAWQEMLEPSWIELLPF